MDTSAMSEIDLYRKNQNKIVQKHRGKVIALQEGEVIGSYASKVQALNDMKAKGLDPGSFLIILCTPGDEQYTRRYRSRVDFVPQVA